MKPICKKIPQTLMILGLAGSGKDTQADLLCQLCDGIKISTGLLAREEIKKGSELGKIADEHISKGLLIPDETIYAILAEGLKSFDNSKMWVFTGVVRTFNQIQMFENTLLNFDRTLDKVIFIELSEESIVHRLSRRRFCPKCGATYHPDYKKTMVDGICDADGERLIQRDDDKPEIIKTRLKEESRVIKQVLNEYDKTGKLIRIDGEPSIPEIHEKLVQVLSNED